MYDLDRETVPKLIDLDDTFIVPNFHTLVLTSRCNKPKVVTICSTDYILFVGVGFATLYEVFCCLVVNLLIHVHFDGAIPATCYDCVIFATVSDERYLTIERVMFLKIKDLYAGR